MRRGRAIARWRGRPGGSARRCELVIGPEPGHESVQVGLPEQDAAMRSPYGGQTPAVRAEGHVVKHAPGIAQGEDLLAADRVPEPHRPVETTGGDAASIRTKGQPRYLIHVPAQRTQF